ncbi:MAG: arsenate reductase (glutaredoxin) [Phycisphaeraceae bacterium]|nr:arsenate reductase (glutaredoxin) [Phycisphaeraceae bacterium]
MAQITCYHNPRCSKSRQAMKLLQEAGCEPTVVQYLKNPPDGPTLRAILKKLGLKAAELLRRKEAVYRQLNLAEKLDDEEALVEAMVAHPVLIERPIVVAGSRACIGRPPEKVMEIL